MQEKIRRHRKECFGWSMLGRRTERANGTGSPERRHGAGQIAGHGREHSIPCSAAVEKGKSEGLVEEGLAAYLGELYGMDRGMGRLFAALDALKRTNDTVTLFTSDHGPEKKLAGEMGYTGLARGYKTSTLEGGIRLPYVLRWPNGGVPPGRVDGASVISNVDWLPTVLRLAKVAASGRRWGGDGVDVLPHWLGRTGALPHRKPLFWSSTSWRKMVVRVGPWKLTGVERERPECNSSGIAGLPLRLFTAAELNELKLLNGTSCTRLGLASLYHIDRDPAEERNLLEMLIAPPPAADARLAEHVASAARRCVRLVSTEYRPLLKLEGAYSPLGSVKRML